MSQPGMRDRSTSSETTLSSKVSLARAEWPVDAAGNGRAVDRNNVETPVACSTSYQQNHGQCRPNSVLRYSFEDLPAAMASAKKGGHVSQQPIGTEVGVDWALMIFSSACMYIGVASEGYPSRRRQFTRFSRGRPCPRCLKELQPTLAPGETVWILSKTRVATTRRWPGAARTSQCSSRLQGCTHA